jgi:hypothetical protein
MKIASNVNENTQNYPLDELMDFMQTAKNDNSFVFISGPSWSGKTQLVYIFDQYSQHPMWFDSLSNERRQPVFFCVIHIALAGNDKQKIYKAVEPFSNEILSAITSDYRNIKKNIADYVMTSDDFNDEIFKDFLKTCGLKFKDLLKFRQTNDKESALKYIKANLKKEVIVSTEFIEDYSSFFPWATLAVIKELILKRSRNESMSSDFENRKIRPLLLKDFEDKHLSLSLPALICLDEFSFSISKKYRLLLLRNFIRFVPNLIPVLLGTNTRVTNMVSPFSSNFDDSRGSANVWCRIVLKLPAATLDSVDQTIPEGFRHLETWLSLYTKRPGILYIFFIALSKINADQPDALKMALESTLNRLVGDKPYLKDPCTMEGYYEMIFSKFHVAPNEKHNCSLKLIHKHLAHLHPDATENYENLAIVRNIFKKPQTKDLIWYRPTEGEDIQEQALITFQNTDRISMVFEPRSVYLDLSTDELTNMIFFSDWSKMVNDNNLAELLDVFKEWRKSVAQDNDDNILKAKLSVLSSFSRNKQHLNLFSFSFRLIVECLFHNVSFSEGYKRGVEASSGDKLEILIVGSFVKASAAAGPNGDKLETFLLRFVSELSLEKLIGLQWDPKALTLLGDIKDQLVPYVIASNYRMSPEFRSLSNVFTGTLPDLNNIQEMDGQCIPDWVSVLNPSEEDKKANLLIKDSTLESLVKSANILSHKADCQLFITTEMKNYARKVDVGEVRRVLRKAILKGRKLADRWPKTESTPLIHHLHLFCVSSLADIQDWASIRQNSSHVIRVLQLTYDNTANKLGLIEIFPASTIPPDPIQPKTSSSATNSPQPASILVKPLNPITAPTVSTAPAANEQEVKKETDAEKELKSMKTASKATKDFPHSTVLIVPLKDLFGYGLESITNTETDSAIEKIVPAKHSSSITSMPAKLPKTENSIIGQNANSNDSDEHNQAGQAGSCPK